MYTSLKEELTLIYSFLYLLPKYRFYGKCAGILYFLSTAVLDVFKIYIFCNGIEIDIQRQRLCNIIITCNDVDFLTRLTFWFGGDVADPNINKIQFTQNIAIKNGDYHYMT